MFASRSAFGSRVHSPLGPRKSGTPEAVDTPAPVSATTREEPAIQRASSSSVDIVPHLPWHLRGTGDPTESSTIRRRLDGHGRRAASWSSARAAAPRRGRAARARLVGEVVRPRVEAAAGASHHRAHGGSVPAVLPCGQLEPVDQHEGGHLLGGERVGDGVGSGLHEQVAFIEAAGVTQLGGRLGTALGDGAEPGARPGQHLQGRAAGGRVALDDRDQQRPLPRPVGQRRDPPVEPAQRRAEGGDRVDRDASLVGVVGVPGRVTAGHGRPLVLGVPG
jgi:hypothetical protein